MHDQIVLKIVSIISSKAFTAKYLMHSRAPGGAPRFGGHPETGVRAARLSSGAAGPAAPGSGSRSRPHCVIST